MSISDQLRRAIRATGKSRYWLSGESGVDQATLSRFVRGKVGLTLVTIDRLCRTLGLELRKKPKGR